LHPYFCAVLSVSAGAVLAGAVPGQEAAVDVGTGPEQSTSIASNWWGGNAFTGNWGGVRDQTAEKGLSLHVEYTGDVWGNVSGGLNTGSAYLHLFQFGLDWNPEPLIPAWRGGLFRASGIYPYANRSLTGDLIGDLNGADNIEAPSRVRLYEFWYLQDLWQQRLQLQVGNLLIDEEFAYNNLADVLINSGFGWSQFTAANTGTVVPAYPFAALGLRLEWRPSSTIYLQGGVYDGDALDNAAAEINDNPHGLGFELDGDQGLFAIAEFGYQLNQGEGDEGLPGAYKIGGFYHSAESDDLYYDDNGDSWVVSGLDPMTHSGSMMFYVAAEQRVWVEPKVDDRDEGLGVFFRLGVGPDDRNPIPLVLDGGVTYRGLLPGREKDTVALGAIYAELSDNLRRQERDDRDFNGASIPAVSDYELVLELTYQAELTFWWYLQPDLQCILHPGGSSANSTAWVVGLRTGIVF
jgi:porin